MKKPKPPKNLTYWLGIAKDLELSQQFEERGNERQKKALKQAQRYLRWLDIQKQKDREYFAKQLKKRTRRKREKKLKRRKKR